MEVCQQTITEEQRGFQIHLMPVLKIYGLDPDDFAGVIQQFFMNPETQPKIMEVKQMIEEGRYSLTDPDAKPEQQNYTVYGKDTGKKMDRDFCMNIHYKLHDFSIAHLREIKKDPKTH